MLALVTLFGDVKETPDHRLHAEHREQVRCCKNGLERTRICADSARDGARIKRGNDLETFDVIAKRGVRLVPAVLYDDSAALAVRNVEVHTVNAVGVFHVGRRSDEQRVDRAEHRRVRANADRE
jgi:hypothetical protein